MRAALRAAGVSKRFGGRTVLDGFALTVERGEFVALTGPSGSGKSTALNIVGLIATPTRGRVEIDGTDLAAARDVVRSRHRGRYISFVYQGFHLAPTLTVAENVELGVASQLQAVPDLRRRAAEALEAVGVGHVARQLPGTLSGGEQQRVAIARALARRTPLLLADEPTGNLDRANADAILGLLQDQVRAGAALVLVTHDPTVAARADRTVVLSAPEPS